MLQKASIKNLSTNEILQCQFNPPQLSLSKQNNWRHEDADKKNIGTTSFGGGQPASLKVDLFFDTTSTGQDVRQYTHFLVDMTYVLGSEPPRCLFTWGKIKSFEGYIKSVGVKFTMFLADGTPVRATTSVEIVQIKDETVFSP